MNDNRTEQGLSFLVFSMTSMTRWFVVSAMTISIFQYFNHGNRSVRRRFMLYTLFRHHLCFFSRLSLPSVDESCCLETNTSSAFSRKRFPSCRRTTRLNMSSLLDPSYFEVKKNGITPFETMAAYLGGSAFQTVVDNPVTAYRQLVQQFAKGADGKAVDPRVARLEANAVFKKAPVSASLSGLGPRLVGVGFKRIPKFGALLGISYILGEGGEVGMEAAVGASILSAPFINPIRMIEKQQRAYFKTTGKQKGIGEILKESAAKQFKPLFRGTIPLMGHSLASATTGLVGQPELEKYIRKELGAKTSMGQFGTGLVASSLVSPIYVLMTNPLSRLEVIMQTSSIQGKSISVLEAIKEVVRDSKEFGLRGVFRGQAIGIAKAIVSLTMFHHGRIYLTETFKARNERNGIFYEPK